MRQAQITLSRIKASKLDSHSEINGRAAKKHECSDHNWESFSSCSISCESWWWIIPDFHFDRANNSCWVGKITTMFTFIMERGTELQSENWGFNILQASSPIFYNSYAFKCVNVIKSVDFWDYNQFIKTLQLILVLTTTKILSSPTFVCPLIPEILGGETAGWMQLGQVLRVLFKKTSQLCHIYTCTAINL